MNGAIITGAILISVSVLGFMGQKIYMNTTQIHEVHIETNDRLGNIEGDVKVLVKGMERIEKKL